MCRFERFVDQHCRDEEATGLHHSAGATRHHRREEHERRDGERRRQRHAHLHRGRQTDASHRLAAGGRPKDNDPLTSALRLAQQGVVGHGEGPPAAKTAATAGRRPERAHGGRRAPRRPARPPANRRDGRPRTLPRYHTIVYLYGRRPNERDPAEVESYQGETLRLYRVTRQMMAAYMCIASNDVPPAVSKRVPLNVNCEYRCVLARARNSCLGNSSASREIRTGRDRVTRASPRHCGNAALIESRVLSNAGIRCRENSAPVE